MIRLEGDIDIASSAELKASLIEAVSSGKEVRIDLERASDFDVTAVQLLWAGARAAGKTGTTFALAPQTAENIDRAAREMGFASLAVFAAVEAVPGASTASPDKSADD